MPKSRPLRVNADMQAALLLETMGKSEAGDRTSAVGDRREHPKDQEALTALGNLQRSRKHFPDRIDSYTKVINLASKPDRSHVVAVLLSRHRL